MATIKVLEARNLKSTDPNGLSDPYCVIGIADPKTGEFVDKNSCVRSETKRWTLTPSWKNGTLELNKRPSFVRIEIWDKDEEKEDDFVGCVVLPLDKVSNSAETWVPLSPKQGGKKEVLGDLHVVVQIHGAQPPTASVPPVTPAQTPVAKAPASVPQATPKVAPQVAPVQQTVTAPAAVAKPPAQAPAASVVPPVTQAKPSAQQTPVPAVTPTPAVKPPAQQTPVTPTPAVKPPAQQTPVPAVTPTPAVKPPAQTPVQTAPVTQVKPPTQTQVPAKPAPVQTPAPVAKPVQQTVAKPTPKPLSPEEKQKQVALAEKYAKLAATYKSHGYIMEALEYYNLSSALFSQLYGASDKRAVAAENAALGLMMGISFGGPVFA